MRALFKNIYIWIISLFQSVVSIISIIVFNRIGINHRIVKLACKKERPASILSNGPSIKDIISDRKDLLNDTDLLVLNFFGNTSYFWELKPKYYVLFDIAFFDYKSENVSEVNQDMSRSEEKELWENFKNVNWDLWIFVPYSRLERKAVKTLLENKFLHIVEFNGTEIKGFSWFRNLLLRRNQGVTGRSNVVIPSLILLTNIGYNTIYLYGAELSWTKSMDVDVNTGRMFFKDSHFYDTGKMRFFDKGGYRWWLEVIARSLKATEDIADYADSRNVRIVNRTKGSFIDAFEYENPDTIKRIV